VKGSCLKQIVYHDYLIIYLNMYPLLIYPKILKNTKVKNFTFPLLNHPCHEVVWGSGNMVPRFRSSALDRGYLSLSLLAALPLGKGSQYRLQRRSAPQSRSGLWRTQMLFYLSGNRIRIPPPYVTCSSHYTNWALPALSKTSK